MHLEQTSATWATCHPSTGLKTKCSSTWKVVPPRWSLNSSRLMQLEQIEASLLEVQSCCRYEDYAVDAVARCWVKSPHRSVAWHKFPLSTVALFRYPFCSKEPFQKNRPTSRQPSNSAIPSETTSCSSPPPRAPPWWFLRALGKVSGSVQLGAAQVTQAPASQPSNQRTKSKWYCLQLGHQKFILTRAATTRSSIPPGPGPGRDEGEMNS